jgi:hypothetical protein
MIPVVSFANSIKPKPFDGSNCKRWQDLLSVWLTTMNVMHVASGMAPEGVSVEAFQASIISVLADNLIDTYLHYNTGKEVWKIRTTENHFSSFGHTWFRKKLHVLE